MSAVDSRIVVMSSAKEKAQINRTELSDLLWEASDIAMTITRSLCETGRVWADLDLLMFVWNRLPELVKRCRRVGVIELAIAEIARTVSHDTATLFAASELVDGCQLDLLARPEHQPTRDALAAAVDVLAEAGDLWFLHALGTRSEVYFNAAHAVLVATDHRCQKERNALLVR